MISITPEGATIAIICIILSIFAIVARLAVTDVRKIKEYQKRMKEMQAEIKDLQKKGDTKSMQKVNEEFMLLAKENLTHGLRPMLITTAPFLLIFLFMSGHYGDMHPAVNTTLIDYLPTNLPLDNVTIYSDNAVYYPQNQTVAWNLSKIHADSTNEVLVRYNLSSGDLNKVELKESTITYTDPIIKKEPSKIDIFGLIVYGPNAPTFYFGTVINASSEENQTTGIITLEKKIEINYEDKSITEKITYKNTASNNVVDFPVYLDLNLLILSIHMHNGMDWFLWYFIVYMILSLIVNKIAEEVYTKKKLAKKS